MGMGSVLVQAPPLQLQEFQENPRLVYQYVTGDPGEGAEFARMEAIARATFNRMGIPAHMRQAVESEFPTMAGMTMKPGPHPATPNNRKRTRRSFRWTRPGTFCLCPEWNRRGRRCSAGIRRIRG